MMGKHIHSRSSSTKAKCRVAKLFFIRVHHVVHLFFRLITHLLTHQHHRVFAIHPLHLQLSPHVAVALRHLGQHARRRVQPMQHRVQLLLRKSSRTVRILLVGRFCFLPLPVVEVHPLVHITDLSFVPRRVAQRRHNDHVQLELALPAHPLEFFKRVVLVVLVVQPLENRLVRLAALAVALVDPLGLFHQSFQRRAVGGVFIFFVLIVINLKLVPLKAILLLVVPVFFFIVLFLLIQQLVEQSLLILRKTSILVILAIRVAIVIEFVVVQSITSPLVLRFVSQQPLVVDLIPAVRALNALPRAVQ